MMHAACRDVKARVSRDKSVWLEAQAAKISDGFSTGDARTFHRTMALVMSMGKPPRTKKHVALLSDDGLPTASYAQE
eukprot:1854250-Karenia_brevis.AAC.1